MTHGVTMLGTALASPLFSEQTFLEGVSFKLVCISVFAACPAVVWPVGRGLQLACWPPAARWRQCHDRRWPDPAAGDHHEHPQPAASPRSAEPALRGGDGEQELNVLCAE